MSTLTVSLKVSFLAVKRWILAPLMSPWRTTVIVSLKLSFLVVKKLLVAL